MTHPRPPQELGRRQKNRPVALTPWMLCLRTEATGAPGLCPAGMHLHIQPRSLGGLGLGLGSLEPQWLLEQGTSHHEAQAGPSEVRPGVLEELG